MSQNSVVLPTSGTISGLQQSINTNNAIDTLRTCFSGASAPSSTAAFQFWADMANNLLKMRNGANNAWIVVGKLDVGSWGNGTPLGTGRNIQARTNASNPTTKIDMSADELVLRDPATGQSLLVSGVSVSADITVSGANGLDTGTEAAGTWYYGWIIGKTDGTLAGLISTSATAPTLPSGYTLSAFVTPPRNDPSSNFLPYRQRGNEVFYEGRQNVLSGGGATTETAVSLSSFVPPIAHTIRLTDHAQATDDGSGAIAINTVYRYISGLDWLLQQRNLAAIGIGSGGNHFPSIMFEIPNVSQQIYYLFQISNGSSPSLDLFVQGFKLPLGGE